MNIFQAIEQGNTKAIEDYITSGGNVNAKNDSGYTMVYWAAVMGHAEIVNSLKTAGAASDIFIEAAVGDLKAVMTLINSGVDVNATNRHGHTALMMAAHQGHADIVKALVAAGADIDGRHSISGNTALIGAAHQGHVEIVQILVDAKAEVSIKNKGNGTALSEAVNQGHADVADILRAVGAQA
ncbi:MAG: ankyrin repeat domain-containing protein [Chloroflexota bacterium]